MVTHFHIFYLTPYPWYTGSFTLPLKGPTSLGYETCIGSEQSFRFNRMSVFWTSSSNLNLQISVDEIAKCLDVGSCLTWKTSRKRTAGTWTCTLGKGRASTKPSKFLAFIFVFAGGVRQSSQNPGFQTSSWDTILAWIPVFLCFFSAESHMVAGNLIKLTGQPSKRGKTKEMATPKQQGECNPWANVFWVTLF